MTAADRSPVDYWWPFPTLQLKREDWDRYAKGYRRAASLLLREIGANPADVELLLFPLVQCYRHYLELRLKELVLTTSELKGRNAPIPRTHDLSKLWKRVRPMLQGRPLKVDEHETWEVEGLLATAQALDPFATDWRYPQNRNGKPSGKGLKAVNPAGLSQLLSGLGDYLDGFSMLAAHEIASGRRIEPLR
jgi:hypothetical protein